jgi:hypothetical protein
MAEHDQRERQAIEDKARATEVGAEDIDDEDEASSPFDHPAFLPVLLWGLAAWFGYDGWINQDPDMLEHVAFNRWGFGILVALGLYFTFQSVRDARARNSEGSDPN